MLDLFKRAVQQGKEPVYIVRFENGIEAEIRFRFKRG